jgi:hypothetical protein
MKMHANARLSLKGRELLIERVGDAGWSLSAAAEAAGISDRTARSGWSGTGPKDRPGCWIAPQPHGPSRTAPTSAELR